MPIKIDYQKCCFKNGKCTSCACEGKCNGCVEACLTGALTRENIIKFDKEKCSGCRACIEACKHDAISLDN